MKIIGEFSNFVCKGKNTKLGEMEHEVEVTSIQDQGNMHLYANPEMEMAALTLKRLSQMRLQS